MATTATPYTEPEFKIPGCGFIVILPFVKFCNLAGKGYANPLVVGRATCSAATMFDNIYDMGHD